MHSTEDLRAANDALRIRLEEVEDLVRAIRSGGVDALVIEESGGHRVYTLEGADRPYRLLVEEMQQGAATLQADGTIVYCNRRLAELLETPHETLVGSRLVDYVTEADRSVFENLLWQGKTLAGRGEARLQRADGDVVPSYLTFNALPPDCGAAIGVLVTDLTAQKHHEQLSAGSQALRESEERLRIAQQVARIGTFEWNLATGVSRWTAELEGIFGLTSGEFAGSLPAWEQLIHPDDCQEVVRLVTAAIEDGRFEHEWRVVWPDGTIHWVAGSGSRLSSTDGRSPRFLIVHFDITERKRLENEARLLAANLSDADHRKNEFLAMLAHELRDPLAPIQNAVQSLRSSSREGDAPLSNATIAATARLMQRQLSHMVRLVDDLLDVSRISHGKIDLRTQRIDVATVVQQSVEASRAFLDARGHQLTVTLPEEPVHLVGDGTRLAQVVGNLLHNAGKFTEPGGRIWLSVERQGETALIRVRDTGRGIAADQLTRVFELFTQVDTALDRSVSGLGIGLALVKDLVEMHGGSVEVHSPGPGRGSEFVVRLPVTREANDPEPVQPSPERTVPEVPRRILVVDDNPDSADSLSMLLGLSGHDVRTANDGVEAVEVAANFEPDLVLLDIGLPRMNGYEVCRRIREQPAGDRVVLVALTGWGQAEDRVRTAAAGFNAHLVKPLDYDALRTILAGIPAAVAP